MSAYGSRPVVTTYCLEQHHVSSFRTDCLPTCLIMLVQMVKEGEEDEEEQEEEEDQVKQEVEQEEEGLQIPSR